MNSILKKYKLISGNNIHYLFPDEIIEIYSIKDKDNNSCLVVKYYDDEFCMESTIICDKIIVENYN